MSQTSTTVDCPFFFLEIDRKLVHFCEISFPPHTMLEQCAVQLISQSLVYFFSWSQLMMLKGENLKINQICILKRKCYPWTEFKTDS